MAVDLFLIVRNPNGFQFRTQSVDQTFAKYNGIQLESYSLGFTTNGGKIAFDQLMITKPSDINSPLWTAVCGQNVTLPLLTLFLRTAGAGTTTPNFGVFEIFSFGTVTVQSYTNDITSGDGAITETINFGFGQLEHRYYGTGAEVIGGSSLPLDGPIAH